MEDPVTIRSWRRIDARVTTSGQPTGPELGEIAALGVKHVINLALHSHEDALPDEAASVQALGMRYTHIPVIFQSPTEDQFARFRTAFEATAPEPVHVHCIMNWRVSAFIFRYQRDVLGIDPALARAGMERIWQPDDVWERFIA